MPKLIWIILPIAACFGLTACGPIYEEYATQTSLVETIDQNGNVVQTATWEYPDGERTTTRQTFSPNDDVERRRGPGHPPVHLAF